MYTSQVAVIKQELILNCIELFINTVYFLLYYLPTHFKVWEYGVWLLVVWHFLFLNSVFPFPHWELLIFN